MGIDCGGAVGDALGCRDQVSEAIVTAEEGNGNPLRYSCLENSMDRGAWRATVHGVANS